MATAVVEERQLLKTLRWWDGFAIALANPGFLLGSLGFTLGIFGVGGSIILWGIVSVIAVLQAFIYAEPATMFPEKTGGISLYAHEAWRRYTTLIGPITAFGYWIGWSVVLAIFGKIIGDLIQAQWFASTTFTVWDGVVHLTLGNFIAIGVIIAVWLFNIFGVQPFKWLTWATGTLLMIPLLVFIIVPYLTCDWHSSNIHTTFPGPWGGVKLAIVYCFILAWSAYGTEVSATFAPEFKDTRRDTAIALRTSATFSLLVYTLVPLGLGGVISGGAPPSATAEGQFYVTAFQTIGGHTFASIMLVCLIASLVLSMSTSTADAGRALYGISRAGMTIKEFGKLNRFNVPGRAMTLDLVVNICLVLFISSNLAILYMSNIGYVTVHVFALSGVLLLRKDRPNWPRPIRLARPWLLVAGMLCLVNAMFVTVGGLAPKLNGYGTWTDFAIGVGILLGSVLLFFFRHIVEDREKVRWREETPTMPEEAAAPPAAVPAGS
jgi:amino acid transporter